MIRTRNALACLFIALSLGACKGTESTVNISYEGLGSVVGEGIDCGTDCDATFKSSWKNAQANKSYKTSIVAIPESGYEFYGWNGSAGDSSAGCGQESDCSVTIKTLCNDNLDFRPEIPCTNVAGNSVFMKAIFVPENSIVSSAWYNGNESCLINSSGELYCWGVSIGGDKVPLVTNPAEVKITSTIACVRADGGLQCWGSDSSLGDNMPELVAPGAFAVSNRFACAVDLGVVKCWGGSVDWVEPIPALSHPSDLWANYRNICAQDENGIQCWGLDSEGQAQAPALNSVTRIAAGYVPIGGGFSCALASSALNCWGEHRAFMDGPQDLVNPVSLASNYSRLCVVDARGLRCWSNDTPDYLVQLPNEMKDSNQIQLGSTRYMCGVDAAGIECWSGVDSVATYRPAAMANPQDFYVADNGACGINGASLVCWGGEGFWPAEDSANRTLSGAAQAVATNGDAICVGGLAGVECWSNHNGVSLATNVPVGLVNVTELEMTDHNACAIHSGGVTCWGDNSMSQLNVPELTQPSQLALGRFHGCALDESGVVCWGGEVPH